MKHVKLFLIILYLLTLSIPAFAQRGVDELYTIYGREASAVEKQTLEELGRNLKKGNTPKWKDFDVDQRKLALQIIERKLFFLSILKKLDMKHTNGFYGFHKDIPSIEKSTIQVLGVQKNNTFDSESIASNVSTAQDYKIRLILANNFSQMKEHKRLDLILSICELLASSQKIQVQPSVK